MPRPAISRHAMGRPDLSRCVFVAARNTTLVLAFLSAPPAVAGVADRSTLSDSWFGLGGGLADRGFTLEATLIADESAVLHDAASRDADAHRHLLDAGLGLDLETALGWRGASVFVGFQTQHGENASAGLGGLQWFSNIDAEGHTEVPEAWIEQRWSGFRGKFGKVDANSEFGAPETGSAFLNAAAAFSPTIFVLPTYPDPALSLNLAYEAPSGVRLAAGLYDGAGAQGVPTGQLWGKTALEAPHDAFMIAEGGWSRRGDAGLGRFTVGFWHHNGDIATFSGESQSGTQGFFAVAERTRSLGAGEAGLYLQFGTADPAVSEAERHVGAGVTWSGAWARRAHDLVGFSVSHLSITEDAGAGFVEQSEVVYELLYRAQLLPYLSLAPDVQYVRHPGGDGSSDVSVGTLRFELQL